MFGVGVGVVGNLFRQQIARARIGVTLNYYQPGNYYVWRCMVLCQPILSVGGMRAAEGIGLTYGYSRQWTDNVGSGRVEYYSSYLFRPAKVEVFGSTIKGTCLLTLHRVASSKTSV